MAAMAFIREYMAYSKIATSATTLATHCDSEGLIKRETRYDNAATTPASLYLKRDIDTTMSIAWQKKQLQLNITTHHVKSHQDTKNPGKPLTWPETLNVEADAIATQFLRHHQPQNSMIPLSPCPIYLCHQGQIYTGNERDILFYTLPREEFRTYLQMRNKWPADTTDSINWEVYSATMKNTPSNERKFRLKTVIRWLPTSKRLKYAGVDTDECAACKNQEDFDHVWQCPTRSAWRTTILNAVRAYLTTNHTDPTITTEIIKGMESYLHNTEPPQSQQNAIGWRQFFCNLQHKSFTKRQSEFSGADSPENNSTQWEIGLHKLIWQHIRQAWEIRNELIHNNSESHNSPRIRHRIQNEVRDLYKQAMDVSYKNRQIFRYDLNEMINFPTAALKAWVTNARPAIKRCIDTHKTNTRKGQKEIRSFLTQQTHNDPVAERNTAQC
jgi:hypothetical protein